MASDVLEILLREEAAAGFPARRASILLFAIENRAARLRQPAQRETAIYRTAAAPAPPEVAAALRAASFELPATHARQLKVWAHQITPEGASRGLPAVEVDAGNGTHATDRALSNGAIILPISGAACTVRLAFP